MKIKPARHHPPVGSLLPQIIASLLLWSQFQAPLVWAQSSRKDVLSRILHEVGFTRHDLGYAPKGYWNRFPLTIPYRLPSFDDLFREPLKLLDYGSVMANAVQQYLLPEPGATGKEFYRLVYNLGVDQRCGSFRPYDPQLREKPIALSAALDSLILRAGGKLSWRYRLRKHRFLKRLQTWPDTVQRSLALLFYNTGEVLYWRNLAFRHIQPKAVSKLFSLRDLAQTQPDGTKYYPLLDDLAENLDWPSLWYATLKAAGAAESAEKALASQQDSLPPGPPLELTTPAGRILLIPPGQTNPTIDASNCLIVIDFGNNNRYQGAVGATGASNPVSLLLDLGGNDHYGRFGQKVPSAGAGIGGVAVVIDHEGDDEYAGGVFAQGAGFFGAGILLDRRGYDRYRAQFSAQGCGYFGIGLCLDGGDNDVYYLYSDGQGMGGIGGGVGVCAAVGGDDQYRAEADPQVVNLGDYHSQGKINANMAQGAGGGRRGDITDGHAWAGGLGALIDLGGNDTYDGGNWCQGIAYWFATGLLIDRGGNDFYHSCYFTQGSGAHYCNALLLDEGGNDRHELYETAGAALAFGWDFTNALLVDTEGNDTYSGKIISIGLAEVRSTALFLEMGGDDSYTLNKNTLGLGAVDFRPSYHPPSQLTTYYTYAKSFGGFLDLGGNDQYFRRDSTGVESRHRNNSLWLQPERGSDHFGFNNYGVGIDTTGGIITEIEELPRLP